MKALLFKHCESETEKTLELSITYPYFEKELNGRLDFVGDNTAIEIDHSMKPRSFAKLKYMRDKGYEATWIILRPTGSYPRKFGTYSMLASEEGIMMFMVRSLQSYPKFSVITGMEH
jgi:hypothetical protein